ncbi:unnamed protein product [Vitrella brassicaformis CCMP3155]|uniref:Uncharacterized protein n=2 Tax=Vitrella brassicaformis TaxID=1169539 RepID=A0A0G4EBS7_VITBC|nr:unnamed protein product [Vitrella brassicaformis CCMP3155]|eukprot:CEL92980.1 unnamed protein product [Vitrella brassicaformis CCMP3155]
MSTGARARSLSLESGDFVRAFLDEDEADSDGRGKGSEGVVFSQMEQPTSTDKMSAVEKLDEDFAHCQSMLNLSLSQLQMWHQWNWLLAAQHQKLFYHQLQTPHHYYGGSASWSVRPREGPVPLTGIITLEGSADWDSDLFLAQQPDIDPYTPRPPHTATATAAGDDTQQDEQLEGQQQEQQQQQQQEQAHQGDPMRRYAGEREVAANVFERYHLDVVLKVALLLALFESKRVVWMVFLALSTVYVAGLLDPIIDYLRAPNGSRNLEQFLRQFREEQRNRQTRAEAQTILDQSPQTTDAAAATAAADEGAAPAEQQQGEPSSEPSGASEGSGASPSSSGGGVLSGESTGEASSAAAAAAATVQASPAAGASPTDEGAGRAQEAAPADGDAAAVDGAAADVPPYVARWLYQSVVAFFMSAFPSWTPNSRFLQ